jgi:tRNA threonylcarbamoyladenosine biosynthesis protein TsaE
MNRQVKMYTYTISSAAETAAFGRRLAARLKAGDIIGLSGDLGAGKTTLSKSIIKGLGVRETVTSPTFTIVHEYQGRLPVFHFDVYRIESLAEMDEIGFEEYLFGEGVCIVEWAEKVSEILPDGCIWITLQYGSIQGNEEARVLTANIEV